MGSNSVILALVSGLLLGGLGAGIGAWATRKRTKAETVDLITESAERIILRLESIIAKLETENGDYEAEIRELRQEMHRLRGIIRSLGHDPDDPKFRAKSA